MRRYTVQCLQCGQPRSYADSIYEYLVSVEFIPYGKSGYEPFSNLIDPAFAKTLVKALCQDFVERSDPNWEWYMPTLQSLNIDQTAAQIRVVITLAFTD